MLVKLLLRIASKPGDIIKQQV